MIPNPGQLPVHYLQPGRLFVGESPHLVVTVLGSCVSITLFDTRRRVGAISHALLPYAAGRGGEDDYRFVDTSLSYLLAALQRGGSRHCDIESKVFGGGDVLAPGEHRAIQPTVGKQNIAAARAELENARVRLCGSSVGGPFGRKIVFDTSTGDVLQKRLPRLDAADDDEDTDMQILAGSRRTRGSGT